mmetsp:Transcript_32844/g.52893  ORF Transcript_32844/g.52893 Transcript_32844/m.52893 type:complete len:317 (+) Transcript_32844:1212-2162(+)
MCPFTEILMTNLRLLIFFLRLPSSTLDFPSGSDSVSVRCVRSVKIGIYIGSPACRFVFDCRSRILARSVSSSRGTSANFGCLAFSFSNSSSDFSSDCFSASASDCNFNATLPSPGLLTPAFVAGLSSSPSSSLASSSLPSAIFACATFSSRSRIRAFFLLISVSNFALFSRNDTSRTSKSCSCSRRSSAISASNSSSLFARSLFESTACFLNFRSTLVEMKFCPLRTSLTRSHTLIILLTIERSSNSSAARSRRWRPSSWWSSGSLLTVPLPALPSPFLTTLASVLPPPPASPADVSSRSLTTISRAALMASIFCV